MNQQQASNSIKLREQFKASALSGSTYSLGSGQLRGDELTKFNSEISDAYYFVYSYGTPIAWYGANGWYVVSQKFSQTTSRHQNIVRGSMNAINSGWKVSA